MISYEMGQAQLQWNKIYLTRGIGIGGWWLERWQCDGQNWPDLLLSLS